MIDEDELDEVEEGLVDLAMRGWRTLDEHPLDPRSKRVQLEHNELSTLPKTIGTLEFMWKLDVSHNRLEALPRTIGKCTRLILNVERQLSGGHSQGAISASRRVESRHQLVSISRGVGGFFF